MWEVEPSVLALDSVWGWGRGGRNPGGHPVSGLSHGWVVDTPLTCKVNPGKSRLEVEAWKPWVPSGTGWSVNSRLSVHSSWCSSPPTPSLGS